MLTDHPSIRKRFKVFEWMCSESFTFVNAGLGAYNGLSLF